MGSWSYIYDAKIDDSGVSAAILFRGENSGQTSIKCRDLACDVEPPPLKNCKDLTMKLETQCLFPTSFSGTNVYIYQMPEGLGMKKILTHGVRMQMNPQTRADVSWIFTNFHGICGFKVQLAPSHGKFINGVAKPKLSVGRCPVQIPLGARPGLGTQPRYQAADNLRVKIVKTQ